MPEYRFANGTIVPITGQGLSLIVDVNRRRSERNAAMATCLLGILDIVTPPPAYPMGDIDSVAVDMAYVVELADSQLFEEGLEVLDSWV